MKKVGIFGGTFNPIHRGHLLAAETALEQATLDRILWVPTPRSPYKSTVQTASFADRCEMVRLAIESYPHFGLAVDAVLAATYAIETLQALQHCYGSWDWYWILGLDAFRSLPRWVSRRELIPQCTWLVAPRLLGSSSLIDTAAAEQFARLQACCQQVAEQLQTEAIEVKWQLLQMPMVQISSSLVRQRCQEQRSIQCFVPEAVQKYLEIHRLYEGF